ncbi:MAG TPA: PqiC family protein [Polyangia bacterium]|nr:PqiC family protein [Polyangia bacterium]
MTPKTIPNRTRRSRRPLHLRPAATWATLATLTALAGCASAPARFYTLSLPGDESAQRPAGDPLGPTVVVAPAAVPELVDRPQLVILTGAHQVVILEQQRWAEPLRAAIPRVVAEGLGRQLGAAQVSTRDEALRSPDCRVYLDVRRFDARRELAVDLEALWTVSCAGGVKRGGRTLARAPVQGAGTEAIVIAQGRALRELTLDLARALRETGATVAAREER